MNSPSAEPPEGVSAEPAAVAQPGASAEDARSVDLSKPVPAQAAAPADQPIWAIGPAAPDGYGASYGAPFGAPPPDWVAVADEPRTTPRDWVMEILTALAVAVALTGIGVGLAYVWEAISPRTVLEMTADGAVYTEPNPEGYVAGESVYLLMTAGLGILSPVAVWLLVRRRRGPILLTGLAVGSVAGATLMAWLGSRIGLDEYRRLLTDAPVGTRFEIPVRVYSAVIDLAGFKIQGAVLVQAMIAVAIYTFLAGFYPTASLRPERASLHFMPPEGAPGGPPQGPPSGPGDQPGPTPDPPDAPGAAPTQPGVQPAQAAQAVPGAENPPT